MSDSHSTTSTASAKPAKQKPAKPSPDYPLTVHPAGYYSKKIRGRVHYFGRWDQGPDAALAKYLEQKDDLEHGRTPKTDQEADGLTVRTLVNKFLNSKREAVDAGELTARTWSDYHATCERIVESFGRTRSVADLGADDFAKLKSRMTKNWGPVTTGNEIQRIRVLFKFAHDARLIDKPVWYGPAFKRPSKKVLRKARNARGPRMFEADEIRAMIDGALVVGKDGPELVRASVPMRAMILLGVNCGYGNADCGTLPLKGIDLEGGWIDYPRPKTEINRRAKLWPETVQAVNEWIERRPDPKDPADAELVFVTKRGASWAKTATIPVDEKGKPRNASDNPVTKEMRKLLDALGINGHRNFYALRHTFETIAGESRDQAAVDHVMGHARDDMASVYRERISDERLTAVAEVVRGWLFSSVK